MNHFNHRSWRRFVTIAGPYWVSADKWKARGLLLLLVVLLFGQAWFNVLFNEQSGEFTSALASQNEDRFWKAISRCLVMLTVAVPIHALYYYVRDTLGLQWRHWLTNHFLQHYFQGRAYYQLSTNPTIDNPDQRMADDINAFTQRSLYFLGIALGSLIQLIAFSGVLWSISHLLVYFLVFYAILGTVVTVGLFGRPLIGLNLFQIKREADFRFGLIRVRENAEAIALYRGEDQELAQVQHRFDAVCDNYRQLIWRQLGLNLFQYAYSFLTLVIPSAVIAERVISGELEVGRAVQAAGAFTAILSALAIVVENFESLSRFAAGIDRLATFRHYLDAPPTKHATMGINAESQSGAPLVLENVTLQTPDHGRSLIVDLNVSVPAGEGLMIVGPSGGGKSSLLRAIAGLWSTGEGHILKPVPQEMLFLPQHPYMIVGSLRKQLLYPNVELPVSNVQLQRTLERVNLPHLAERFGGWETEIDWGKVLSVGEQQRLAVARILLNRPRFSLLDEATSALDIDNEERLYRALRETSTTLVSVSHHARLLKYHRQVLELGGDGTWRLHPAHSFHFAE